MELAKKTKGLTKYFFMGLLLIVLGIIIIVSKDTCRRIVLSVLGVVAVGNGIYSLIFTRRLSAEAFFQYLMIFKGMLSIVIGLLSFFLSIFVEKSVSIMIVILAVYFLIETVVQFLAHSKLKDDEDNRKKALLEATISFALAIALFLLQFDPILLIIGIVMIVIGLIMAVFDFKNPITEVEPVETYDEISGQIE